MLNLFENKEENSKTLQNDDTDIVGPPRGQ
jgi:hypothetical protein